MALRILVAEDDFNMLQGICDALALAGYETQPTSNGLEALACLEKDHFDLILSDIMMPKMDGYELFEQVRSNPAWTAIPFIFLTAKGQKTDIRLGKQLGADDYLVKPFEVEDLLVAVQSKMERTRALQRAADEELAYLKQTILNTFSHEFRTPLTYISGYTELLQSGDFDIEELREFLTNIRKGSDRLRRMVEDFLFAVMLETNEASGIYLMERFECTDLSSQIAGLLDKLQTRAETRRVELKRELPPQLPPLICHIKYILDAVERLVDNAIKFSRREGGTVTIRAWADKSTLYIAVSDDGIGINAEQQSRLFGLFSQIDRDKMEQQGTGIGLFIVKGITELHGGQVQVASSPSLGSTFTLSFPRHTAP